MDRVLQDLNRMIYVFKTTKDKTVKEECAYTIFFIIYSLLKKYLKEA